MTLPVVVGADGSEPSLRAVDWAADEAVLRGLPLRVVYASLWERYEGTSPVKADEPDEQVMAEDIVYSAARRARRRHPDLHVSVDVLPEEPEYALVNEGRHAAALVLATRGRGGLTEMVLGSVSLAVAAHADCPVIVLRGSHDNRVAPASRRRVVVGVSGDGKESPAVRFAADEARRRGVPLEAVRAWRCPAHESTAHPLSAAEVARPHEEHAAEALEQAVRDLPADVELHRHTVEGHARRVLLDAAADADLLVVGAKRRDSAFGLQLGRVAHAVLHRSSCPVAVVPHRV
ncbi:universal stress protein [Streptomyces sp. NPDC005423]|uniref:universal stress protein n=1 Tax=Streptomyces sp. NPDC005423 TaxID=3155343 RepID=UPI0033BFA3C0